MNNSLSANIQRWLFPKQYDENGWPSLHSSTMEQAVPGSGSIFNNRYHVLEPLGSGGMANVYLAFDEVLGRDVALKVLDHRFVDDEEFVERFRREARIAAVLSHPNIASIHDLRDTENGTYYMVMEYVPGGTLKDRIRKGPLPPSTAITIALQVAQALEAAHAKGTIHRDVKPQNILLTEAGAVKVVDFGIARAAALSKLTQTGHVLGTAYYMSPEQAEGKSVNPRSDLYSLGVVLYEMLTGKLPYKADTASLIAANPAKGSLRPPKEVDPVIPDKLSDTVVRLLAHDPKQRCPDASSLIADLERARGARSEGATTQPLSTALRRAWTAYKSRTRNKTKPYTPLAPSAHLKKPVKKPLSELIMEPIGHIGPRLRSLLGSDRRSGLHPLLFDRPFRGSRYKPAKRKRPRKVLSRVLLTTFILMAVLAMPNLCSQASISGTQERRANELGGSASTPIPLPSTTGPPSEFHQTTEIPSIPLNDSANSALPNLYDSSPYYPPYQEPREEVETQVEDLLEKIIRQ